jgi:predicted metal-dependent phosphoesterase TrpH
MSRCDLHIHSKFSARSGDWLFRRFDFPDSCTEPLDLYAQLRERGMDFITITDHDCIDGCLAIADKPRLLLANRLPLISARFV